MEKKLITYRVVRVPCVYGGEQGVRIERCRGCEFFSGTTLNDDGEIETVNCTREESIILHHPKITSFTAVDEEDWNEYQYTSTRYDEKIDGSLEKPYWYCTKCCFLDRNDKCTLRRMLGSGYPFEYCYEGEIWKKKIL